MVNPLYMYIFKRDIANGGIYNKYFYANIIRHYCKLYRGFLDTDM